MNSSSLMSYLAEMDATIHRLAMVTSPEATRFGVTLARDLAPRYDASQAQILLGCYDLACAGIPTEDWERNLIKLLDPQERRLQWLRDVAASLYARPGVDTPERT
jgi:hypothetical protein